MWQVVSHIILSESNLNLKGKQFTANVLGLPLANATWTPEEYYVYVQRIETNLALFRKKSL